MTMAPTSEERREAAERLRDYALLRSSDTFEAFFTRLNGVLFGDEGWKRPDGDVFARLADLIDPTCEVDYCRYLYGCCAYEYHLSCGHSVDRPWRTPPAYCPECGARCIAGEGDGE